MNHTQRKYYIILAVKKDNPKDIVGFCEGSFNICWKRNRVNLWEVNDNDDYVGKPARDNFNEMLKSLKKNYGSYSMKLRQMKGKKTMLRKQMSNHACKNFHPCGRSRAEYLWNWVKHYSMWCGKHLRRQGYEIRPYRVGSKHCPVVIDFTERIAIDKKQLKWDKFKWRNPIYRIKQTI